MKITGTHFNYYFVCHRKLWLFSNGIQMEHTSDLVYEGRLIHDSSYPQRSARHSEIEIDGIRIDYYNSKNKVIHEVKKSDKIKIAHQWQLKYYIYILKTNGIDNVKGLLEYPKLRKTEEISLNHRDIIEIEYYISQINNVIASEYCPERIKMSICKKCSYFDFCWSNEE